jgi:hypothetical protein
MSWTTDPARRAGSAKSIGPAVQKAQRNRRDRARSHRDELLAVVGPGEGAVRSRDHPVSGAANETRTDSRPAQRQREPRDAGSLSSRLTKRASQGRLAGRRVALRPLARQPLRLGDLSGRHLGGDKIAGLNAIRVRRRSGVQVTTPQAVEPSDPWLSTRAHRLAARSAGSPDKFALIDRVTLRHSSTDTRPRTYCVTTRSNVCEQAASNGQGDAEPQGDAGGLARHAAAQGRAMSDVLREWLRKLPEPKQRAKR